MLCGLGNIFTKTLNVGNSPLEQLMLEHFFSSWSFNQEVDSKQAVGFKSGRRVTLATAENQITSTVSITTEFADWAQLGFTFDEFQKTVTNFSYPELDFGTVPLTAPYEVPVPGIVADDPSVFVAVSKYGTWGQPGSLQRGTAPAPGVVQIDNGVLRFDASQAGAPVTITKNRTLLSANSYGGPGETERRGNLELYGLVYSTEQTEQWLIHFPELQRQTRPNLSLAGDVPTLEVEFGAITPSGWTEPYHIINLDTAVV